VTPLGSASNGAKVVSHDATDFRMDQRVFPKGIPAVVFSPAPKTMRRLLIGMGRVCVPKIGIRLTVLCQTAFAQGNGFYL
jgi:hypothetical protein